MDSDKKIERKNLLDTVETSFAGVLSFGESTSDSKSYFLQMTLNGAELTSLEV